MTGEKGASERRVVVNPRWSGAQRNVTWGHESAMGVSLGEAILWYHTLLICNVFYHNIASPTLMQVWSV